MAQLKTYAIDFLGRKLSVTTGLLAPQATAAALISYNDTTLLATIVISESIRSGVDYFPLMVDFEERYYAAGRIKKSRFMKKEGRPTDEAVVSGRMIDRSIRPFFNQRMRNDVQVVITCLSADNENDLDILGVFGASLVAKMAFGDEFKGPLAPIRVGQIEGKLVFNPTYQQRQTSLFDLVLVKNSQDLIPMIEFEGKEVAEALVMDALRQGSKLADQLLDFQKKIVSEGKGARAAIVVPEIDARVVKFVEKFVAGKIEKALFVAENPENKKGIELLKVELLEKAKKEFTDDPLVANDLEYVFYDLVDQFAHQQAIEKGKRPDGRKIDEIRDISCMVGLLPRVHGSGLFKRGLTQALSLLTLAGPGDVQMLESMEIVGEKRFFHHYNFLPFSTGEVKPLRGPGRREIGHGYLAEKAIDQVLPPVKKFPYTMRIVSEIVSSNGSTSMASVCGSSLALFDGGVPLERHVAGISIGLMSHPGFKKYVLLSDIQGPEDHFGDMDFKVAGTLKGINAIQLDVKNDGITLDIIQEAFERAKTVRTAIIKKMDAALEKPRPELSQYAPRIEILTINPAKIKDLIGPGGKIIQGITAKTGTEIDINDDGTVFITATNPEGMKEALAMVKEITHEYTIGEVVSGEVIRVEDYGAFVKISNGVDGLIHVSNMKLDPKFRQVSQFLKLKDRVEAQIIKIDEQNRIGLKLIKKLHA